MIQVREDNDNYQRCQDCQNETRVIIFNIFRVKDNLIPGIYN